jgi:hypothetical protein
MSFQVEIVLEKMCHTLLYQGEKGNQITMGLYANYSSMQLSAIFVNKSK